MYKLSSSLALLILIWSDLATASLSYCRASSPCTIFQDSYSITFQTQNYIYTTFTDAKAYSSFQSSLSAASSATPFEITVASNTAATAITPPPIIIETKPGQFTTIKCCGGGMVYGYFVLNGEKDTTATAEDEDTTCGARNTTIFNQGNFTYNDFTVTVGRTASVDVEKVLGSNTCVTVGPNVQGPLPPMLTPPPVTKTFVAELVLNTEIESSETVSREQDRSGSSSITKTESVDTATATAAAVRTATTEAIDDEISTKMSNSTASGYISSTNESKRSNGTVYVTASESDIISNGNGTHTVHVVVTAAVPVPTVSTIELGMEEEAATSTLQSRRRKNNGARLNVVYTFWILPGSLVAMNWFFQ